MVFVTIANDKERAPSAKQQVATTDHFVVCAAVIFGFCEKSKFLFNHLRATESELFGFGQIFDFSSKSANFR